jgi:transcriptional regulator with XRE-family HTH domain
MTRALRPLRTDPAVLAELGRRLAARRLERNWTQAELAAEAGISKRTLVRLESGDSTQLTNLVRVLRALELEGALEALVPAVGVRPLEQLRSQGKRRKRASRRGTRAGSGSSANSGSGSGASSEWTWDDAPSDTREERA